MESLDHKKTRLFVVLAGIFITNALVAEMIGVKIFSFEETVGLTPGQINLFGFTLHLNLTAGVVIWPVVFITSDLINEYFGKPGVKRISYLTAALIAYAFLVVFFAMRLSPSAWWLEAYGKDADGNYLNIDYAFNTIFGQGQRIIIGSLAAFLLGQLVDAFVFQKLKERTGNKMLWLRSTGSTIISQFIDSFVVLYIAFAGVMTNTQIVEIGFTNYVYKFVIAVLLTPVIYGGHWVIDRYLGAGAERVSEQATKEGGRFF